MPSSTNVILDGVAAEWRLPGIALVEFSPTACLTTCVGRKDIANGLPVTGNTIFPLASVTKTFTAELLASAVERGSFSWDSPIRDILPDFRLSDPRATEQMTLRDAACHRSGLPPHTWAWVFSDLDRRSFIRDRVPHLSCCAPFDEGYHYSNLLYALLGLVLESESSQSWEETLTAQVFHPLDMQDTHHLDEHWSTLTSAVACPYATGPVPLQPFVARRNHLIAPASEVMGSMNDLAKWGQALLLLNSSRESWTKQNLISETRAHPDLGPLHVGLGWRLEKFQGRPHVWHSGQCSGSTTLLSLFPGEKRGLALATNQSGAINALYRILYTYWDQCGRSDWAHAFPAPTDMEVIHPPPPEHGGLPLAPSTVRPGAYVNAGYGTVDIQQDGRVWSAAFQGGDMRPLSWTSNDSAHWTMPIYDIEFPLTWDETGESFYIPFEPKVPKIRFDRVRT